MLFICLLCKEDVFSSSRLIKWMMWVIKLVLDECDMFLELLDIKMDVNFDVIKMFC